MSNEEFEAAVEEALAAIPERFLQALDNIQIAVQDEPDEDQLAALAWEDEPYGDEGFDGDLGDAAYPGEGDEDAGEDSEDAGEDREGAGELFGLYEGIALTERDGDYGWCEVPDIITIFKGPHERCFDTREEVVEEIGKTVVHEIGHYFGLDDEKLYAMGY